MKKFIISLFIVSLLTVNNAFADHPKGTVKVDIYGLVCDFCARALEKVFGKEQAVDNIDVDLENKIVTIHFVDGGHLDNDIIRQHIIDAGYNVEEIRYGS